MLRHSESIIVAWAECDAAGKVFYPNFYIWFDRATEKLFRAAHWPMPELWRQFQIVGMPLLESGAEYQNACLLGAELRLESWIEAWSGKPFIVRHRVTHADGRPALLGREKRVFVVADSEHRSGIRAIAPPPAVVEALGAGAADSEER